MSRPAGGSRRVSTGQSARGASCLLLWKIGHSLYSIAISFYLLTILPVIGIITVGDQAYADRYTYITTSLFYLALSYSIVSIFHQPAISHRTRTIGVLLSAVIIFSLLGMISSKQIQYWKNDESLWLAVIKHYPKKVHQAYQILGNTYLLDGRYEEAINNYNIALTLKPDFSKTYENLGRAYGKLDSREMEINNYLLAIKHDDDAIWPRLLAANYFIDNKDVTRAEKLLREALKVAPHTPAVVIQNAKFDLMLQRPMVAKARLNNLVNFSRDNIDAHWILAQIFYAEGNKSQSTWHLKKVLAINPSSPAALQLQLKISELDN